VCVFPPRTRVRPLCPSIIKCSSSCRCLSSRTKELERYREDKHGLFKDDTHNRERHIHITSILPTIQRSLIASPTPSVKARYVNSRDCLLDLTKKFLQPANHLLPSTLFSFRCAGHAGAVSWCAAVRDIHLATDGPKCSTTSSAAPK